MDYTKIIHDLRLRLGSKVFILGHYYQSSAVLRHADAQGDSLELARRAAGEKQAEHIIFCGVHFMAESAALLAQPSQSVYMPDPNAGCPMADMAPVKELRKLWEEIEAVVPGWLPVIYVNSSAAAKAFCGAHGGCACTSSNATRVMRWALDQGKRVFFIPDENLARNTAHELGLPDNAVATADPRLPLGGLSPDTLRSIQVLAWKGFCPIHAFTVEDIATARQRYPEAKIIVHPETPAPVMRLADAHGSTSQIIKYVEKAPDGATIVIGTEYNLVKRLTEQHKNRLTIVPLRISGCRDMALTTEEKLYRVLQNRPSENIVRIPAEYRADAKAALQRMLDIS